MAKRALITGITGQDGSYLAELLLDKGYEVFGAGPPRQHDELLAHRAPARSHHAQARRPARSALADPRHRRRQAGRVLQPRGDVVRAGVVGSADADRRVQLAGRHALLEAVRQVDPTIRFYQASSSEMFGKVREVPQTELTPFYPRSPYGVSKVFAPLHHGQLPRELRPVRGLRHPLQPRVAAPRPRVRDAQGHRRRRAHQARARRLDSASAISTRSATGASPATTSARCG